MLLFLGILLLFVFWTHWRYILTFSSFFFEIATFFIWNTKSGDPSLAIYWAKYAVYWLGAGFIQITELIFWGNFSSIVSTERLFKKMPCLVWSFMHHMRVATYLFTNGILALLLLRQLLCFIYIKLLLLLAEFFSPSHNIRLATKIRTKHTLRISYAFSSKIFLWYTFALLLPKKSLTRIHCPFVIYRTLMMNINGAFR